MEDLKVKNTKNEKDKEIVFFPRQLKQVSESIIPKIRKQSQWQSQLQ